MHFVSKHIRLSEPTTKMWMKIDLYFQRRRCSPMIVVSGSTKFMRIFAGFPRRVGVKRHWGNQNMDFKGFRTLRFRHLRKWAQHYYIVLFSPLSLSQCTQNTWPWMTLNGLNGPFTVNFHYYTCHWLIISYLFTVYCVYTCDQRRSSEAE